jgi:excisionase family DNA binding protein
MTYTLGEAAKATGLSKPTISKAIKSGKLSAIKNENGSYTIDPAELFRVYKAANSNGKQQPEILRTETLEQLAEMLAKEQQERERERGQLLTQIEDLRRRLDEEATERRKLTALLTHQPASKPKAEQIQPPSSLYEKLFGKKKP